MMKCSADKVEVRSFSIVWGANVKADWGSFLSSAFLWQRLECRLHEHLRPLPLPDLVVTHTNQHKPLCMLCTACCDVQRWGSSHRDDWELYIIVRIASTDDVAVSVGSSKPHISDPSFFLCHFPKMWVSLVNTPKQTQGAHYGFLFFGE